MAVTERNDVVTFKGEPVTLVGQPLEVGQQAPDFELIGQDMSATRLSDYGPRIKILSVVPSLDTSVCDAQTRRFNQEAEQLGDQVVVLTVSMDLPMAQKRWCGATGAERVQTLSDYKDHQFGQLYGLRIKELGLLARAVLVLDGENTIQYAQLVPEIAREPDYQAALQAARELVD